MLASDEKGQTPSKFDPQVLLVTPHVSALEPWTSKKSLPRSIADGANSCAAAGTFYYQYVGKNPTDAGMGELLKYSTTSDTWATGTPCFRWLCRIGQP